MASMTPVLVYRKEAPPLAVLGIGNARRRGMRYFDTLGCFQRTRPVEEGTYRSGVCRHVTPALGRVRAA